MVEMLTVPGIINVVTTWIYVKSFTPRQLYPREKRSWFEREAGWATAGVNAVSKLVISVPARNRTSIPRSLARTLVTVLTELLKLY